MAGSNPFYFLSTLFDPGGPVGGVDLSIGSATAQIDTNARILVDDVFLAGSVDLAPILASIVDPGPVFLVVDISHASGAVFDFDGVGASTIKAKRMIMEFVPDGVTPVDLELTLTSTSRVRVWCYGDIPAAP